jgi:isocitrate/isopropylmalate dehydrogenase
MMKKTIAVLEGDGIGPEIVGEGINVLKAVEQEYGHTFHLNYAPFGAQAYFTHGSAPDIAGKNIANPYAMIGSVAFLLDKSFGLTQEAHAVWSALLTIFEGGYLTAELETAASDSEKVLSTNAFGDMVVDLLVGK